MYAVKNWDEEVIKWLAVGMVLGLLAMAVVPAINIADLAAYLASQGNGAGAAGSALVGAGLIRITPEMANFLLEAGLISSSTGVGIAVGGILVGVSLAL